MLKNFLILSFICLFFCGCIASSDVEKVGKIESSIYNGYVDSGEIAKSVVQIWNSNGGLCSAVAISNNLIVTAYHCVAKLLNNNISCSSNAQDSVSEDYKPSDIKVYTGQISNLKEAPQAIGIKIFHPDSKKLCNNDIAFVVLDGYLDVGIATIRSRSFVNDYETFKVIGYGLNNVDPDLHFGIKMSMDKVAFSGKSSAEFWLRGGSLNQDDMRGGACNGDSGGPAFSEQTNSLVGILSRGGDCDSGENRVYSFVNYNSKILEDAVEFSNSNLAKEAINNRISNKNVAARAVTCSASNTNETTIVPLFFVLLLIVSLFRRLNIL